MAKIIGRFYFKITKTGNLIGEYSNSAIDRIDAELANARPHNQGFIGEFDSAWLENQTSHFNTLKINHKYPNNANIYSLEWVNSANTPVFWGEGMIVDDMLIGDYRDFKKI